MSQPADTPADDPNSTDDRPLDGTPTEAVVTAVAESTGRSPLEIDPLARTIDPDALDDLIHSADRTGSSVTVSFEYCDRRVTVTPSEVRVDP